MFYLRKFHFLIDFCWSLNVYKPLLKFALNKGVSPTKVFKKLISFESDEHFQNFDLVEKLRLFWKKFDTESRSEWFDTDDDIEDFFKIEKNFDKLINQDFEKLRLIM